MKYRCTLRMAEVGKGELSVYQDFFLYLDEEADFPKVNPKILIEALEYCIGKLKETPNETL